MKARAALLGLIIAVSAPLLRAADESKDSLPSAKEILVRYGKEIGGAEAFRKHKSEHVTGTVEMPAQKLNGTMEVFMARPNKVLTKSTIAGIGDMSRGFNGE